MGGGRVCEEVSALAGFTATVCVRAQGNQDLMRLVTAAMEPFRDSARPPEGCAGWRTWNPVNACAYQDRRESAAACARDTWKLWRALVAENPPARASGFFFERHLADPGGYPLEQAAADFEQQPLIKATRAYQPPPPGMYEPDLPIVQQHRQLRAGFPRQHDLVSHFSAGLDAFIEAERRRVRASEVLLTADGSWIEEPWSDEDEGCGVGRQCFDMTARQENCAFVDGYLDELPENTVVVLLACRV